MKTPMRLPTLLALIFIGLCAKIPTASAEDIFPPGLMLDTALILETASKICPDIEEYQETKQACFWPGFFCIADTKSRIGNYLDKHCSYYEYDGGWLYHCDEQETKEYKAFLKSVIHEPSAALKLAKDCRLYPDKYKHKDEVPVKPVPTPEATPVPSPTPEATGPIVGGSDDDDQESGNGAIPPVVDAGNPPHEDPIDIPANPAVSAGGCSLAPLAESAGFLPLGMMLGVALGGWLRARKAR